MAKTIFTLLALRSLLLHTASLPQLRLKIVWVEYIAYMTTHNSLGSISK
jgi:hypothetical protein